MGILTAPTLPPARGYRLTLTKEQIDDQDERVPRLLRQIVGAFLTSAGLCGLVDTAQLVTTELLVNALRHTQGWRWVSLCLQEGGLVVIEVADWSSRWPEVPAAEPDLDAGFGRGLFLAGKVTETLEMEPLGPGKIVRASLRAG